MTRAHPLPWQSLVSRLRFTTALILGISVLTIPTAQAQGTWPQWRGPQRDGSVVAESEWPARLVRIWGKHVGEGYSGPVVSGAWIWVHARESGEEVILCLEADTGEERWRRSYPISFVQDPAGRQHGLGPYSTPSLADGRLYTLSITNVLSVWKADSGDLLWRKDYSDEFEMNFPYFGASGSPLVWEGICFLHFGGMDRKNPDDPGEGAMMALRVTDGKELWRWPGDAPSLGASPIIAEVDGSQQLLFKTKGRIVGLDPRNGKELWQIPFKVSQDNTIVTPLMYGDTLLTSDYRKGTVAWRLVREGENWRTKQTWVNSRISMFTSSPVLVGDVLVGFPESRHGHICGLNLRDGSILWQGEPRWGEHASLVSWGSTLLVFRENGQLVIGEVSRDGFRILQRVQLGTSGTWAHPAVYDDRILHKDGSRLQMFRIIPKSDSE